MDDFFDKELVPDVFKEMTDIQKQNHTIYAKKSIRLSIISIIAYIFIIFITINIGKTPEFSFGNILLMILCGIILIFCIGFCFLSLIYSFAELKINNLKITKISVCLSVIASIIIMGTVLIILIL